MTEQLTTQRRARLHVAGRSVPITIALGIRRRAGRDPPPPTGQGDTAPLHVCSILTA
ncbi:MAG TPA: hypothetical protein VGV90_15125 [Solirubrobacteraceae bacterium]|nr:hypothetical protein [Solirubrobacteraceae bacterium]